MQKNRTNEKLCCRFYTQLTFLNALKDVFNPAPRVMDLRSSSHLSTPYTVSTPQWGFTNTFSLFLLPPTLPTLLILNILPLPLPPNLIPPPAPPPSFLPGWSPLPLAILALLPPWSFPSLLLLSPSVLLLLCRPYSPHH